MAGAFPDSLGPFNLVPTSFRAADFRFPRILGNAPPASWTLSPSSLQGEARRSVLSHVGAARVAGQLSPQHPVTLSEADREAACIPMEATSFAWSYPIEKSLDMSSDDLNADIAFLIFGGYLYFAGSTTGKQTVVAALALIPGGDSGGLRFGESARWCLEWSAKVGLHRFKPVTIPSLRDTGVRYFCWLRPGEVEGAEHGGFAYLFHPKNGGRQHLVEQDVYFPVLGQNAPLRQTDRQRTVASVSTSKGEGGSAKGKGKGTHEGYPGKAAVPKAKASPPRAKLPEPPWDLQISTSIIPDRVPAAGSESLVLVSLEPPTGAASQLTSLCCVLDVSGSMGKEAVIQGASGVNEKHGLSLLDIAKHGVRTIIHTLGDRDLLSLVAFNHKAQVVIPPTRMSENGRTRANRLLDDLKHGGGTDIWQALQVALQTTRSHAAASNGAFSHIMLLTDGTSKNRDTILPNLQAYKNQHGSLPCSINTFGFGYKLDSKLLVDLASIGDGSYSFIPDAGFVGTVFISTLSNLLVTMARQLQVDLEVGEGAEVLGVLGGYEVAEGTRCCRVMLGNILYGQNRDFVVRMKFTEAARPPASVGSVMRGSVRSANTFLTVNGQCEISHEGRLKLVRIEQAEANLEESVSAEAATQVERHKCRSIFVESIAAILQKAKVSESLVQLTVEAPDKSEAELREAQLTIEEICRQIAASPAAEEVAVKAILEDIQGQTSEALSRQDWYDKWGKHYLPSLMFAHKLQQCNNFKDPGVQLYGGILFETARDHADDIFNTLPAPKPSLPMETAPPEPKPKSATATTGGGGPRPRSPPRSPPAPVVSMAAYNNYYGGCIDGRALVEMADGRHQPLADVKRGDQLLSEPGAALAKVVCLVRTRCPSGRAVLVRLPGNDVKLTPYHPVHVDGTWRFPAELAPAEESNCDAVYGFVLEGAPSIVVGGVPCVALGHGLQEGAAAHPYFGTERVVCDLRTYPGFQTGLIDLHAGCQLRDRDTGLVCGLQPQHLFVAGNA